MPYTIKQARKKSTSYQNQIDADKQKQLKSVQENLQRMAISGSDANATNPLRDDNGFLISYEGPDKPGTSLEEPYQYVRLPIYQKSATVLNVVKHYGKKMQFEEILPTSIDEPTTDDTDLVAKEAELNAKVAATDELNEALEIAIEELNTKIAEM